MKKKAITIFDKKKEYKDKITPIVEKLRLECQLLKIPFFYAAATYNDEKETLYDIHIKNVDVDVQVKDNKIFQLLLRTKALGNELPKEVEIAKRILEEYLSQIENPEECDIHLTQNLLGDFYRMVKAGDTPQYLEKEAFNEEKLEAETFQLIDLDECDAPI